ncbi:succinylglutamate desuccinylase/aspartoacylase family protein [Gimesia algae]|uniref:Succinylglutamate desuccinylase / Aspartoacylase family protein n=1 Tax=Gimesia algae TaxID=2527971 RepID=A0A517VEL1_9PLAN|nr:succinylglutamate desuccinylase/aspartoacylase family protein [Gimesia algae]QDT91443.1 Succinylglutamate desuccinylase / Aspartoacylase family protein [Gimesia algae]
MSEQSLFQTVIIEGNQPGPHLLILGGIHGDEYEPMAAVRKLITSIDNTRLTGKVTLVPVVNEPAYERTSRTGPDNLDLARTFPGSPEGTITEQIASQATQLIQSADYLIDLHTGGVISNLAPFSGYTLHSDPAIRDTQRRMALALNLPVAWGTSANLDGRSLSAARDLGVPAIYAEWGGGSGCNQAAVTGYTSGCLSVMTELQMLEYSIERKPVLHHIEDDRSESGHLQLQNNAPETGFFEPAVNLMDLVQAGDPLGTITSVTGDQVTTVSAKQTGVILGLRTLPYVEQNEWLAVILETERH